MHELSEWHDFYVIVGSSAGALIGLQFVLISLMASMRRAKDQEFAEAGRAFATPTVVHFTAVLLLGAAHTAAWRSVGSLAVAWGVGGTAGLLYTLWVTRKMTQQTAYRPEAEDWLFHAVLPVVSYGLILFAALWQSHDLHTALFAIAAAVVLLLVTGIHNAWDAATYNVFTVHGKEK